MWYLNKFTFPSPTPTVAEPPTTTTPGGGLAHTSRFSLPSLVDLPAVQSAISSVVTTVSANTMFARAIKYTTVPSIISTMVYKGPGMDKALLQALLFLFMAMVLLLVEYVSVLQAALKAERRRAASLSTRTEEKCTEWEEQLGEISSLNMARQNEHSLKIDALQSENEELRFLLQEKTGLAIGNLHKAKLAQRKQVQTEKHLNARFQAQRREIQQLNIFNERQWISLKKRTCDLVELQENCHRLETNCHRLETNCHRLGNNCRSLEAKEAELKVENGQLNFDIRLVSKQVQILRNDKRRALERIQKLEAELLEERNQRRETDQKQVSNMLVLYQAE